MSEYHFKSIEHLNNYIKDHKLESIFSIKYNDTLDTLQVICGISKVPVPIFHGSLHEIYCYFEGFRYGTLFKRINTNNYIINSNNEFEKEKP